MNIFLDRQDALKDGPVFSDTETEINEQRPLPTNETVSPIDKSENDAATEEVKSIRVIVTREECMTECSSFDGDELIYCKEVCGLTAPPLTTDECENMGGIEEDYCWKNKAITETNFEYCEKIADGNVFTTCKNRVTEDIVDAQNEAAKGDL